MTGIKSLSVKKILFTSLAFLAVLAAGEMACRVKYFKSNHGDSFFLLTPFVKSAQTQRPEHGLFIPAELSARNYQGDDAGLLVESTYEKPCRDRLVFSPCQAMQIPSSYNSFCWRRGSGQREAISLEKAAGVYRIIAVGGSTVESEHIGDEDLWTARLEKMLNSDPTLAPDLRFEVINAGHSAYDSRQINRLINNKGFLFKPDLILYYEAINEQIDALEWFSINEKIKALAHSPIGGLHKRMYMVSMLYTYLVEKYFYRQRRDDNWQFDEERSRSVFLDNIRDSRANGADLVYLTQVIDYPLADENGEDLRDEQTLRNSLAELYLAASASADSGKDIWDEINARNQRLINIIQQQICEDENITVIDLLPEFDLVRQQEQAEPDENRRREDKIFRDLCHKTCAGDKLLAEIAYPKLREYLIKNLSPAGGAAISQ